MKARIRSCVVVVVGLLSALVASQAALASDDNGSGSVAPLTGQTLIAEEVGEGGGSSEVTGTCNPEGTSTFRFTVTGSSVGLVYPGTFTETGTITMGPALAGFQPVTFESTFTITSLDGSFTVNGDKSLPEGGPAVAFCGAAVSETGDANAFVFQADVEYSATITTAAGSGKDSGISNVDYTDLRFRGDPSGLSGFAFVETFTSTGPPPGGDDDDGDDDGDDDDGGDG